MEQPFRPKIPPNPSLPASDSPFLKSQANQGQPPKEHRSKSHPSKFSLAESSWLLEISCLAVSVASFAGLIYILVKFNGKRLLEWKWDAISINTIISILSTISRTTLTAAVSTCIAQVKWNWFSGNEAPLIDFDRFDGASRGLWGSFRLVRTMIRRPHWIMLGVFASIVFPVYGPFLQALVHFENKAFIETGDGSWLPASDFNGAGGNSTNSLEASATIGRCPFLNVGTYTEMGGAYVESFVKPNGENFSYGFQYSDVQPDFGMTAAIWGGLAESIRPSNLWPSFACSSGNCTWDSYTSLAVCSKCNDISALLVKTSGLASFSGHQATTLTNSIVYADDVVPDISYRNPMGWLSVNTTFTKYRLPSSGLSLSNYDGPSRCNPSRQYCPDTYMTANFTTNPGLTTTFQDLETLIFSIQVIKADESWVNNKTLWQNTKVSAQECSLSFCIAEYDSKVSNGNFYESFQTWNNRTLGSFAAGLLKDEDYNQWQNYSLDLPDNKRDDLQLFVPSQPRSGNSDFTGQTFNISQGTIAGGIGIFSEGFKIGTGNVIIQDGNIAKRENYSYIAYPAQGWMQPAAFAQSLGKSANVKTSFANLASSLSKWMRDQVSNGTVVSGRTMQNMVVITVSWPYLILPALTMIVGSVAVLLSIIDTTRKGLPAWKSDALILLGPGVENSLSRRLDLATTKGELYEMAREDTALLKSKDGQRKLGMSRNQVENIG